MIINSKPTKKSTLRKNAAEYQSAKARTGFLAKILLSIIQIKIVIKSMGLTMTIVGRVGRNN